MSAVWYNLGTLYESCKQPPDAKDAYQHALELDQDSPYIRERLHRLQLADTSQIKLEDMQSLPAVLEPVPIKALENALPSLAGVASQAVAAHTKSIETNPATAVSAAAAMSSLTGQLDLSRFQTTSGVVNALTGNKSNEVAEVARKMAAQPLNLLNLNNAASKNSLSLVSGASSILNTSNVSTSSISSNVFNIPARNSSTPSKMDVDDPPSAESSIHTDQKDKSKEQDKKIDDPKKVTSAIDQKAKDSANGQESEDKSTTVNDTEKDSGSKNEDVQKKTTGTTPEEQKQQSDSEAVSKSKDVSEKPSSNKTDKDDKMDVSKVASEGVENQMEPSIDVPNQKPNSGVDSKGELEESAVAEKAGISKSSSAEPETSPAETDEQKSSVESSKPISEVKQPPSTSNKSSEDEFKESSSVNGHTAEEGKEEDKLGESDEKMLKEKQGEKEMAVEKSDPETQEKGKDVSSSDEAKPSEQSFTHSSEGAQDNRSVRDRYVNVCVSPRLLLTAH